MTTGNSPIEQRFAYDLAGNRVYTTDLLIASATAYDSHGRAVATRHADGTIDTVKLDENGQATEVKTLDPSATETVSESSYTYSQAGRLESMKAKVNASTERSTTMVWDGGGRTTGIATGGRASRSTFDTAGRQLLHSAGAGSATALSEIFSRSETTAFDGDLPATTRSNEKGGPAITTDVQRDTAGSVTQSNTGSLEWKQTYDELGNMTKASAPGRPSAEWDVDPRGAVKEETLPDGAKNTYKYDGSGAQTNYEDPTSEATSTVPDLLGRPTLRTYADGTSETITYEGSRVKTITDRQGRMQTYVYNSKGQLEEVRSGTTVLDHITYDTAGRMISWRTPDSEVTWSEFDLEGRPRATAQRRFRNGTLLDEFTQVHRYNEHGERKFASMPVYPGLVLGPGWTKGISEEHDAMGNITMIGRADAPGGPATLVMAANYRSAGRPDLRAVMTAGGSSLAREYAYATTTGQLVSLTVRNANGVIAGSEIRYDGLQKRSAALLGVASGERFQHWSYDARSRVAASLFGVKDANADPSAVLAGRAKEELNPADFRTAQERTPALDAATRDKLAAKNVDTTKIDPPSASFTEQTGHKIAEMTKGPQVRPFGYQGAERIDDGRFAYEFDVKGRLIRAIGKATSGPIRSISYTYSGAGRLVGRRAEYSTTATNPVWQLEDRQHILSLDGLPADTTFVWDAITDRLVSIFKAGATPTMDAHGGLLKQVIHGGAGYDDPIETATIDPANGAVTHLYPIYDEAGSGSLQAIVNTNGQVIARNLSRDPYGAEDVALAGAAVDSVKIDVRKTSATIDSVVITLHSTEELAEATIATGARLASVDNTGAPVRTTTVTPKFVGAETPSTDDDDRFALRWTLTFDEWNRLTDPTPITIAGQQRTPTDLSVAATSTLRATNWSSDLPLLPAPTWVQASQPVFTSDTLPIEIREPFNTLGTFIAGIPTDTTSTSKLYEIDSLTLLGSTSGADGLSENIVSARMHAHPFTEPMTRLNYVRARWFDPESGTWLTPDPLGYRDSSNLYAFAGGDPVNGRDPRGEGKIWDYVKGELEEKAGNAVALGEAVVGFGEVLFRPDRVVAEKLNVAVERAANIVAAHAAGGYDAAKEQYVAEVIDSAKSLPFVRTVVAGLKIPEAGKKSRFQKGLQTGRTALSFAGDAALVYGAVSAVGAIAEASIAESTSFSISPLSNVQLSQAIRSRAQYDMFAARGQVAYGATDLSAAAFDHRVGTNMFGGRNVAVFDVNGELRTFESKFGVGHSERIGYRTLNTEGVPQADVLRVYSELEPCGIPGGYCGRFVDRMYPDAAVTYSFEYGDAASRALGRQAKKDTIQALKPR